MKRVLINAANLHVGGGVQVAASFIRELARFEPASVSFDYIVLASSEVDRNLRSAGWDGKGLKGYRVFDVHGLGALRPANSRVFKGFDVVFTIFGPLYVLGGISCHVVGFAQAWILSPINEASTKLGLKARIALRLKFALQWLFFESADRLVVELPHVKRQLVERRGAADADIAVVHNCVSRVYFEPSLWEGVPAVERTSCNTINLGCVARDYAHKNLDFIVEVCKRLAIVAPGRFRFFVTLTEREWAARSAEFRELMTNVGPLTVAQCPSFYQAMDGVIFPSLLECFSATPLEALAMRRPLFASDRGFVRDVCAEHAMYFDPLDPASAAALIVDWFERKSQDEQSAHVERGYRHLRSLPGSRERARAYLEIIEKQLKLSCSSV